MGNLESTGETSAGWEGQWEGRVAVEPAFLPELNSSPSGSQAGTRFLDFKNVPAFSFSPGRTGRSGPSQKVE